MFDAVLPEVATLCDSVYIVKKGKDDTFYTAHDGIPYEIENEMIVPYLKNYKNKIRQPFNYWLYALSVQGW